jgi:hypothetical protein
MTLSYHDSLLVAIVTLASAGGLLLVIQLLVLAHLCWRLSGWWAWKCCWPWWDCCGELWLCFGCPTRCCACFWEWCWCWWEPEYVDETTGSTQIVELPEAGHWHPTEAMTPAVCIPACEVNPCQQPHHCYSWMSPTDGGPRDWNAGPVLPPCTGPACVQHTDAAMSPAQAVYVVEPLSL